MTNEHLATEKDRHPTHEPKLVTRVSGAQFGHTHVTFEDGSMDIVRREEMLKAKPTMGEFWPPVEVLPVAEDPLKETADASSEQSATGSDGDSGAQPCEAEQEESGPLEDEPSAASRLRRDKA